MLIVLQSGSEESHTELSFIIVLVILPTPLTALSSCPTMSQLYGPHLFTLAGKLGMEDRRKHTEIPK